MKIVADENIPLVKHFFAPVSEVILKPGRTIQRSDVVDADILLVRAVTKVDKSLLQGTQVKFVGTPTSGLDHLDTQWLDENKIAWAAAEGCNTMAVVEYVLCVIAAMQKKGLLQADASKKLRAGVIGSGRIGSRVATQLRNLNFEVLECDPLREKLDKDFVSTPLEEFFDLDFITLHTSLSHSGEYPTYHLIEKNFLKRQKNNCVLLNSSRGEVIDFSDLKKYGQHLHFCLDVWEDEPNLDPQILESAVIATPHIAGYSVQSKIRGIEMIYKILRSKNIIPEYVVKNPEYPKKIVSIAKNATWQEKALTVFDPLVLTQTLKKYGTSVFDQMRKDFNDRFEFEYVEFAEK